MIGVSGVMILKDIKVTLNLSRAVDFVVMKCKSMGTCHGLFVYVHYDYYSRLSYFVFFKMIIEGLTMIFFNQSVLSKHLFWHISLNRFMN